MIQFFFPDLEKEVDAEDVDYILEVDEADTNDGEYMTIRDKVRGCNS